MPGPFILKKSYINHLGLDLKSSDLTRPLEYSSGMKNAQYRKSGAIEKRKGFQASAANLKSFGVFTYNKVDAQGVESPEVICASTSLYRKATSSLTVAYTGLQSTCLLSLYFDPASAEYRCEILEGANIVLNEGLGIGYDEATPVTVSDLQTAINAVANFTATLTGSGTTPAAFIEIVRTWDLSSSGGPVALDASYWMEVNKTVTSPLAGSNTNRNNADFENVSATQLANCMYLANGYDDLYKYDGQTFYKAGLPEVASIVSALGAAGAVTGTNYRHVAAYSQKDAVGNIILGPELQSVSLLNPVAQSMDVTVANIQAGSGFNTNCAVKAGAQALVNTLTVDDGSGGQHTMKVGDTAYFFDAVSADYVEREVTAVAATTITVAGAAVTVADNAVISNNLRISIFRNTTSAIVPDTFYLVADIPNNSFAATQVYNDNLIDTALGEEYVPPVQARGLPPRGKYITSFQNQLCITGNAAQPYTVFFSDIEHESFPIDNQFDCQTVNGDIVTGISPNNELLSIFKRRSIFNVAGTLADANIRVDLLTNDIGCEAHASIKEIKGALMFLFEKGPYFFTSGQIPTPMGGNRLEPVFAQDNVPSTQVLRLKRAVALHDRKEEKYILSIPAESSTAGDVHTNSFARTFAYDYTRDAWLEWSNIDYSGGATISGDEVYWVPRVFSTFDTAVRYRLTRRHNLNDAWDYQDNEDPLSFEYKNQWEALGEPSLFKKFLRIRVFGLEETINNDLTLNIKSEQNFVKDVAKADFDISFTGSGYGVQSYGTAAYGSPAEAVRQHKLFPGKMRSMRLIFSNVLDQQNVAITGWELEIAAPYNPAFQE